MAVNIPDVLQKYSVGDGLADDELEAMIDFFKTMEDGLNKLSFYYNAGYGLARDNVVHSLIALNEFKYAREKDRSL